jgi:hypothetical protein
VIEGEGQEKSSRAFIEVTSLEEFVNKLSEILTRYIGWDINNVTTAIIGTKASLSLTSKGIKPLSLYGFFVFVPFF